MRWYAAAAIFIGIQILFASLLAATLGFYELPPFIKYAKIAASLVGLVGGTTILWRLRTRPASPLQFLQAQDWGQLRSFAGTMVLVWLQFVTLTWAKVMLPLVSGMWADPALANLEATLLGQDAWRFLPRSNPFIDVIYMAWAPTIGIIFSCYFFSRKEDREAGLLAFFLTIGLLGTFGQYLLPSGGPIFYERLGHGTRFAEIKPGVESLEAINNLWDVFVGKRIEFASGISAFPSIHVAGAAWFAIIARRWWAYIYLGVIFAGSIILGWHYALDGIAGAAGALACYAIATSILAVEWLPSTLLVGGKP